MKELGLIMISVIGTLLFGLWGLMAVLTIVTDAEGSQEEHMNRKENKDGTEN